jgi:hypothetical protein
VKNEEEKKCEKSFFFFLYIKEKSHLFFQFSRFALVCDLSAATSTSTAACFTAVKKKQFLPIFALPWEENLEENLWKARLNLMYFDLKEKEFFFSIEKHIKLVCCCAHMWNFSFYDFFLSASKHQKSLYIHELSIAVDGWTGGGIFGVVLKASRKKSSRLEKYQIILRIHWNRLRILNLVEFVFELYWAFYWNSWSF